MHSHHKKRMRDIGSVAIPPKGTMARARLEQILKEQETPEQKKIIKKIFQQAQSIAIAQNLNGAGHETDQTLRSFQADYNHRIWNYDLHSLSSTFNVIEAFLKYDPRLNMFILRQESNHLFSFTDFVDWYTSENIDVNPIKAIEALSPERIYTYDTMFDPANLLYSIEKGTEIGVVGFAMIRFGSEVSVLCVAGEVTDLKAETDGLKKSVSSIQYTEGREEIKPEPSLEVEAVAIESKRPLWRLISLTRFDINDMTQSVRYVCHDAGNSYTITTDDPSTFLNMKGEFATKNIEDIAQESAIKMKGYNSLFDLCSTSLFLPQYFEKFSEDISVQRFKTNYADKIGKLSFKKYKKHIPHDLKVAFRNVDILQSQRNAMDATSTIYSIPNFHIQTSGYWRTLGLGKTGTNKKGEPIHGRTWVSKKLTWMEAEAPNALVAKKKPKEILPDGPAPGYIYLMRSPLQLKNVFKVGFTKRTTAERAAELSNSTGVPGKIYVMHEWAVGNCVNIEKEVHKQLSEYRVDPRREFFEAPLQYIVSVIETTIQTYDINKHDQQ